MKHKVAELEGALLDAAVAKAEGWAFLLGRVVASVWSKNIGGQVVMLNEPPAFSSDWAKGGPIIERERIVVEPDQPKGGGGGWTAFVMEEYGHEGAVEVSGTYQAGPTPLIAAMRSFVASCFGDEVELPRNEKSAPQP